MFVKSKLVFKGRGITATPYNDRWLNPRAVDNYSEVLDYEATTLLKKLYARRSAPINPQPHAGRTSLNNILTIAFGLRTDTIDHPLVAHWLRHSREFM